MIMKTTVSLFLFVTILLLGSGCKTTNLATEKVSHEQAIQALEQHSFKIVIEEIYDKKHFQKTSEATIRIRLLLQHARQ